MSPERPPGGVLAIDLGSKKHGFASADPTGISTQPLDPLREPPDSEDFLAHVERLVSERDVSVLLLGLPLNDDGTESPQCALVHRTADLLRERLPQLALVLHDEHLTTKAAEDWLRESDLTREQRHRWKDSAAALLLLRDWLST